MAGAVTEHRKAGNRAQGPVLLNFSHPAAFGHSEFMKVHRLGERLRELTAGEFRGWTLEIASDSEGPN